MLKQEQYRLRDAVRRVASPTRRATGRRQASRMSFEDETRMLQDTEGTPHGGRALGSAGYEVTGRFTGPLECRNRMAAINMKKPPRISARQRSLSAVVGSDHFCMTVFQSAGEARSIPPANPRRAAAIASIRIPTMIRSSICTSIICSLLHTAPRLEMIQLQQDSPCNRFAAD